MSVAQGREKVLDLEQTLVLRVTLLPKVHVCTKSDEDYIVLRTIKHIRVDLASFPL